MPVNTANKENIDLFIKDNIELINRRISEFQTKKCEALGVSFDGTEIKRYLHKKLSDDLLSDPTLGKRLLDEFDNLGYEKNQIIEIAIKFGVYHKDLECFYNQNIFDELSALNLNGLTKDILNIISEKAKFSKEKKQYANTILKKIVSKSLYMALRNGFSLNINDMESGVMTANAGDSAQFLFLARAILAGYNCSNVDVRSSRYDAVIDQQGKLFRVQIKGISDNSISFKDRDRGGRGIDTQNERNKGKRITSKDCDIYVAVDKQVGICYIIPISKVEEWNTDSISVTKAEEYKENWKILDELVGE